MKVRFLKLYGLMIFAFFCTSSQVVDFFALFKDEKNLRHRDFGINPDDMQYPGGLSIVDKLLVVQNFLRSSKNVFDVYSLNSKRKVYEYLAQGEGPCEIPGEITIWTTRLPQSIEFFHRRQRAIVAFDIGQPFSANSCTFDTVLNYSDIKQKIAYIAPMNDSIFILYGSFSEGRIGVFNSKTRTFKAYFNYPDISEVKVDSIAEKASIYFGTPIFHPNGSMFALTMWDMFEIYEYKNSALSMIKTHYGERPKYRADEYGKFAFLRDTKRGILEKCSTERYIYLLYSTKTLADPVFSGDCLFVFDWNGRPIQRYKFDIPVESIYTNDDKTLYAIAEVGDSFQFQIVTFDLEHFVEKGK